jgi:polyferredoxin
VLFLVLAAATSAGLLHQFAGIKPASVDALCPFGGLESAWSLIVSGSLLAKIAWSSFILLGATLLSALVLRRSFCGNACPLGALQDGFGWLGRKILGRHLVVPRRFDSWARLLKYAVLLAVVVLSAALGTLVIRPYDPWATYQHLFSGELLTGFLFGFAVLLLSVLGSFFYERFFCKYLCPMGAALTPFSRIGLFKIRRVASTCIDCGACDRACPVNIAVSKLETVKSPECIDCDRCVNSCPVKDTLVIEGPGKRRIGSAARIGIVAGIFALVLGVTTFTGSFSWTVPPIAVVAEGGAVSIDVEAIKGSDTWNSIIAASGIPREAFMERFKLKEAELGEPLKTAAHREGSLFDAEAVREFVKERLK